MKRDFWRQKRTKYGLAAVLCGWEKSLSTITPTPLTSMDSSMAPPTWDSTLMSSKSSSFSSRSAKARTASTAIAWSWHLLMILDPDKVESVLGIHVEGVCKILDCTLGSKFKTIGDSDGMTLNLLHDNSTKNNDTAWWFHQQIYHPTFRDDKHIQWWIKCQIIN